MRSIALAVLVLTLAAATPARADKKKPGLFDFSTWKTPVAAEREAVQDLVPGQLDAQPVQRFAGPPRAVRLRIYADRDYRSGVMRWKIKFRAQIDRLNRVVQPLFNVRFEVESLRDWDSSHAGAALERILTDLETVDPATDVDWVIGLVTPFRGVATSIHEVGTTRLLARHFVMRAMDDEEEARAMDQAFKLLDPGERERIYAERKTHKEMVIFLHEWGHTMGVLHAEDRTLLMNPLYDAKQTGFTEQQKHVVGLVLDRRLGTPSQPYPESADLLAMLQKMGPEGPAKDHEHLLELLRARLEGKRRGTASGAGTTDKTAAPGLTGPDVDTFNRALDAVNAGKLAEAWTLLAPLVKRFTAKPEATDAKLWLGLAQLLHRVGALTDAEAALAKADRKSPDAQKLTEAIETTRRRLALPRNGTSVGIPPDKEPAYFGSFWEAATVIAEQKPPAARAHLTQLSAAYPEAPGVEVLWCELELRAGKAAPAAKRCAAGVAKFDEAARAHFLLGMIAVGQRRDDDAEKHLRQAILLDPGEPGGWRELVRLYRLTRAKARIAELSAKYNALFHKPLPD